MKGVGSRQWGVGVRSRESESALSTTPGARPPTPTRVTPFAVPSRMVREKRSDSTVKVWPGTPYPLGATYDGAGTNFSVFSEPATRVELCFFDDDGKQTCVDLPEMTGFIWHGYVPNIGPG
ncbi:MAG: isoamylase, partial [Thermoanaerobaculia bacterium]|nr:isoamylase [Thermoanaerobaculia bacterium]